MLAEQTGVERHDVALVMGSGWLPAVDALGEADRRDQHHRPARLRAAGRRRARRQDPLGRGRARRTCWSSSAAPTSTRASACARSCTASAPPPPPAARPSCSPTAAAASTTRWSPGTPVLISDHINLTATSPIEGANFVDLTDLYSPRLRALCREVDPTLDEGVYVQFPGPALRDPGRDRHGPRDRRQPRRHEYDARGDRRPRGRHGGARHQPGHQPRRRDHRRAAQPRRGARGRPRRRHPDGRAARPHRARASEPALSASARCARVDIACDHPDTDEAHRPLEGPA